MHTSGPLSTFDPPEIPEQVFSDDDGEPIDYGNRWPWREGPPDWSYSVERNLERFEPLVDYAEALIAHLAAVCDVEVLDDISAACDLMFPAPDLRRAVRLTPPEPSAAPLTFAFSMGTLLRVHAGLAQDFLFPVCGCEACDETGTLEIERLAEVVGAVTTGHFQETFGRHHHGHEIEGVGGSWEQTHKEIRGRVRHARREFARRGPWQPWPMR